MCLLIVLVGVDAGYPIIVASNRDERRGRKSAPPGLFVGSRHRLLSPRDREQGGTWIAVSEHGMFAALTNITAEPKVEGAPSRGHLPHKALDADDLEQAVATITREVADGSYNAFQLLLSDGRQVRVLRHARHELQVQTVASRLVVLSNEHAVGQLQLPELEPVLGAGLDLPGRFALLAPVLLQTGGAGRHAILKRGAEYGTVSSSLIGVPRSDPRQLVWEYAAGAPDAVPYRSYGNLGRRLIEP